MRGFKKIAIAAVLALTFSAALIAHAGQKNAGAGPIGTPGSDKTIKAHVLALEKAVAALQARFSNLSSHVAGVSNLQARFTNLSSTVSVILANSALGLGPFVSVQQGTINGLAGPHIFFTGANIHILSGSGATDDFGALRGLGNLVIGYDEPPAVLNPGDRGGSHNVVIGQEHKFSSVGGFAAGFNNIVSGQNASVSGGQSNKASGNASVVSGGKFINATSLDQWAHP